ncbi:pyruvate kinase [Arboricoccus pini]|uniref:Pyruvate kinase n=1 Tax=Arboricoccus pini TaxID=1963835 RepID=A0A212RCE8_9PROT|nr:pyruvate kinase [Arboricoccus pini]SNB69957.1 pyruvate kinase [Arboricoccus pini]
MHRHRHAKIVATIGPASSSPERLRQLFDAGADVFRLNFSHGTHDDHRAVHKAIRDLEAEVRRPICILQDLQGPKIRVGVIKDGKIEVAAGETVTFVLGKEEGGKAAIPLPHPEIFKAILPGASLLIDDGRVKLKVKELETDKIHAEVIVGGVISNRKGVNLPDTPLDLSPLTPKDRADLAFGLELGVDYVALSFVQKPGDLIEARGLIGDKAALLAKIEKPQALKQIEDIVRLSDAIMVARGDLGVEIPHEDVPGRQKELVRLCRMIGKPVIVATQMLDSMVNAPTPTRAEASDVATAIYDGADAVMLSAESASGAYPVEAVTMMSRIIERTETDGSYRSLIHALHPDLDTTVPHAVAASAAALAEAISARLIVVYTSSGTSAARLVRQRPGITVLGFTPNEQVARQMALLWGVSSLHSRVINTYEEMVEHTRQQAAAAEFAEPGDHVVVVAGIPFGQSGTTNNLRVVQI